MKHERRQIGYGLAGTQATLKAIGQLVDQAVAGQKLRLTAISILDRANVNTKNPLAVGKALFYWVRSHIRYVKDPLDLETVQAPDVTLALKAGDCDDHAALMGALAASVGLPIRFVTGGAVADRQSHIWPELNISGRWIAADTTSTKPFGWSAPLPAKNHFSLKGDAMYTLQAADQTLPITVKRVQKMTYDAALTELRLNWSRGRITPADMANYLQLLDREKIPVGGMVARAPVRQAIVDLLAQIEPGTRSIYGLGLAPLVAAYASEGVSAGTQAVKNLVGGVVKSVGESIGNALGVGAKKHTEMNWGLIASDTWAIQNRYSDTLKTPRQAADDETFFWWVWVHMDSVPDAMKSKNWLMFDYVRANALQWLPRNPLAQKEYTLLSEYVLGLSKQFYERKLTDASYKNARFRSGNVPFVTIPADYQPTLVPIPDWFAQIYSGGPLVERGTTYAGRAILPGVETPLVAGFDLSLSNPIVLVALGLGAFMLLKGRR